MDLLGSILGSMDKPPSASEKEKKLVKVLKAKQEREQKKENSRREKFKTDVEGKIAKFLEDPDEKRLKFPPHEKVYRVILHEVAEAAGIISHSFGTEEVDRHIVVFKKEYPPTEDELQALRSGEEYDPTKSVVPDKDSTSTTQVSGDRQPQARMEGPTYGDGATGHYQEKYRHLLGGLDCAEQSAVKMSPNKSFGYVPSSNKRDLRSIEQTLNDMRSRKKPRLDTGADGDGTSEQENGVAT